MNWLILVLSAVLAGLSFYTPWAWPLMWLGAGGMFFVAYRQQSRFFRAGFVFGTVYFLVLIVWFYGLYPMEWIGFSRPLSFVFVTAAYLFVSLFMGLEYGLCFLVLKKGSPLTLACCMLFLEFFQRFTGFGFTWGNFTNSQYGFLPMIQSAAFWGPLGITALILLFGLGLGRALTQKKPALLACAVVLVCANCAFGAWRMGAYQADETVPAAVLQGNFPSYAPSAYDDPEQVYLELAAQQPGGLVLTCENALPVTLASSKRILAEFTALSQQTGAQYLLGAFDKDEAGQYSSLHVVAFDAAFATYRKRHLVPLGEYLPFGLDKLLPQFAGVNAVGSNLTAGEGSQLLDTRYGKVGALICFDSSFPQLARASVKDGAVLLVIPTNDSWYDDTLAKQQFYGQAVLRAVENGRYVLRSANTGISGIISPTGRTLAKTEDNTCSFAAAPVACIEAQTLYTRFGDWILWLALAGIVFDLWRKHTCKERQGRP